MNTIDRQSITNYGQHRIPVVPNVIAEFNNCSLERKDLLEATKDFTKYQDDQQSNHLLKTIKLLTDPHSAKLLDRHLHALKKLINLHKNGIFVEDLVSFFKILNVCADASSDEPDYVQPMLAMLDIVQLPFLKKKSSDELRFQQIAAESVAQLGYLMRVLNEELCQKICETLIIFYERDIEEKCVPGGKVTSINFSMKIIERSNISETMVKSLVLWEDNFACQSCLMKVLQKLSSNSELNCQQMIAANAAHTVSSNILAHDTSAEWLFLSIEILWNLLESDHRHEAAAQINNANSICQLQEAFVQQLTQGASHYDRQLRNDILVILSLILDMQPQVPFLQTGFVKQLVSFSTFQEVKSHNALVRHLKFDPVHEDFELKKLLFNMIILLTCDSANIPVLREGKIMLALLLYISVERKPMNSMTKEWSDSQYNELTIHAMKATASLVPSMQQDFVDNQGSTRVLLKLEWIVSAAGNPSENMSNRMNFMKPCLRILLSLTNSADADVLQDLADQGAIGQLIDLLNLLHECSHDDSLSNQCDVLYILSALCVDEVHAKEIFGIDGTNIAFKYLKVDHTTLKMKVTDQKLMQAAVECVWSAVVGCSTNENYFLEKGGIFILIDLLELHLRSLRNSILGCLVDFLENVKVSPHLNSWRNRSGETLPHLLCQIWRNEEKWIAGQDSKDSLGEDSLKGLRSSMESTEQSLSEENSHKAISELNIYVRGKVYAIFCKIGFSDLLGIDTFDHVTLTVVENFFNLKLGVVWEESIEDLEKLKVRPVTTDEEAIEAISQTNQDRVNHILDIQQQLLEAEKQQQEEEEMVFYNKIRSNHMQGEKAIKHFDEYVARTSNYKTLTKAHHAQKLAISASRMNTQVKQSENRRLMLPEGLNTTMFVNRNIEMELSGPIGLTGGRYNDTNGSAMEELRQGWSSNTTSLGSSLE